jgi:acetyltransferase-like isoleucine patch superfamily enzyme
MAKVVRSISFPTCQTFHSFLYSEWRMRTALWHNFWRVVYYEPMFKSQCVSVGKNFRMEYAGNGTTRIHGNLRITFGNNVHIFDNTQFVGLKVFDDPELIVGDNTYLGPAVRFMVGKRITVGSHCMITSRIITDNPGHSIDDVMSRMTSAGGLPPPESIRPITIGDFCFLPLDTVVYPGANIGDGVVARIGTHIRGDVPPFCQVAGNPMRIVRKLPIPKELEKVVGEQRYDQYLQHHKNLDMTLGQVGDAEAGPQKSC